MTTTLESLRPKLLRVAYQMLGHYQNAEDIVQEVLMDFIEKERQVKLVEIDNVMGYYVKATINKSINLLNKQKRMDYPGTWLPEPPVFSLANVDHQLDIPYAFLCLLAQLNPKERAVFILRESFELPFKDIAEALQLSSESCRKLAERGKAKLKKQHSAKPDPLHDQKELIQEFLAAANTGNLKKLVDKLAHDIVLYSDGGGKVAAALKPIFGQSNVIKFLTGIQKFTPNSFYTEISSSQQELFVSFFEDGQSTPFSVLNLMIIEGKVSNIFIQRNPGKLKYS